MKLKSDDVTRIANWNLNKFNSGVKSSCERYNKKKKQLNIENSFIQQTFNQERTFERKKIHDPKLEFLTIKFGGRNNEGRVKII